MKYYCTLLLVLGWVSTGLAAPGSLTYQGRILKADGTALEYSNVSFVFEILSANGSCTIYREQRNGYNMTNSKGVFDVAIGSGTKLFPSSPTIGLLNVFDNSRTFDCGDESNSASGTYSPTANQGRLLRVQFHDGTGWRTVTPDNEIRTVPFAGYSAVADKLGSNSASDFMLANKFPSTTCTAGQAITFDGTNFSCTNVGGGGGGGSFVSVTAGTGLNGGTITTTGTIDLANTAVTPGTYGSVTEVATFVVDAQGRLTNAGNTTLTPAWASVTGKPTTLAGYGITDALTAPLAAGAVPNLDAAKITTGTLGVDVNSANVTGTNVSGGTGSFTNLKIYDGVSQYLTFNLPVGGTGYTIKWPNTAGNNGDVLQVDGSGNLSWVAVPSAPVSSVAGRTGAVTLSTSDISGLGTSALLNVPVAGNAGIGEVVKGNDSRLTDGRAPVGAATGDLSGSYPNPVVAQIQGRPVSNTAPTDGQALLWDNVNTTWKAEHIRAQDIRNAWGGDQMIPATACAANESMTWSVITDRFSCQAIGSLNASAITAGTLNASTIPDLDVAKITTGVFAPARLGTGTANNTTYLRGDGTWATVSGGAGTLNDGQIFVGNASNVATGVTLSGDGTLSNTGVLTISKIGGNALGAATLGVPDAGKIYRWDGTELKPAFLSFGDLKTAAGANQLAAICNANEKIQWSVITDAFTCEAIGNLDGARITTGTISASRLPAAASGTSGMVTDLAQSFSGIKTFLDNLIVNGTLTVGGLLSANGGVSTTTVAASGMGSFDRVKLSDTATACNAGNEGAIKYNATLKKLEICDGGGSWAPITQGTIAFITLGAPNVGLIGPGGAVTYAVTYGPDTNPASINLTGANIVIGGTGIAGCSVTNVTGSDLTRTVTVGGCTGTGTVNITVSAGSALSTSGDPAPAAGPSPNFYADNAAPTPPTTITLGAVPVSLTTSPSISYTNATDSGGSILAGYQVRIIRTSDGAIVKDWTNHTNGNTVGGLNLSTTTQYSALVRAYDSVGNYGIENSANWISTTDNSLMIFSPSLSSISRTRPTLIADGTSNSVVTVTLRDVNGVPIPNRQASITSSRGGTDTISVIQGVTDANGQAFFWIRSSTVGTSTITGSSVPDIGDVATTTAVNFLSTGGTWLAGGTSTTSAPTGRISHTAVWSGSRMIVWGGSSSNTGGMYDPVTNSWAPTSMVGVPAARNSHVAVWTGSKMIVWGGNLNTGGVYDPVYDTWTPTTTTGAPTARYLNGYAWVNNRLFIWGGNGGLATGALYNPSNDSWTAVTATGAPAGRGSPCSVAIDNNRVFIAGGVLASTANTNTSAIYNASTDSWTTTASGGINGQYEPDACVWTGSVVMASNGTFPIYNPTLNTWSAASATGRPASSGYANRPVWNGNAFVILGAQGAASGQYDPMNDTWYALNTTNQPASRGCATAVWTGSQMVVWGGATTTCSSGLLNTGGVWTP